MSERLIIIGGVAAGMSAAAKAKRTNPKLEIVVYEKSGYVSYGACGFPYFIKGDVPRIEDLIARTPAQMAAQGITAHVHHEVTAVNPAQRTVRVVNHANGTEFTDHWDKLIVTTGASAFRPPIPGIHLPGIFTLRTVEDALAIRRWLVEKKPKHGVIIGAGYIGLEMAEALQAHGLLVTIVDVADQVMPTLDADVAAHVLAELQAHGIKVNLKQPVKSFLGPTLVREVVREVTSRVQDDMPIENGRLHVYEVITQGNILAADIVIWGGGGRPNAALAEMAGIALGKSGAIAVDAQQRTNVPDIWAAGAVTETSHLILGKPTYWPLAAAANKQGRVAGVNAAGGQAHFGGIVGTAVVKAFDLTIAHTGLTEKYALAAGFNADSVTIEASSRAHYMPGHMPLHVKLVFEKGSQRLLGAQMVGKDGVAKRIDVIAAALHAGWTVDDLTELDLSYAPPFAPVWDPILVAANVAKR
ncbi:MAG: FAD-dependent oxidoreductase [Chloroflexota bacterium]|nr:FAD-dependent oxidoreductase [Anaerolineales bacterium]